MNLPLHHGLYANSRLRFFTSARTTPGLREWLILGTCGVTAALASTFLDFNLRVPGHAILRVIFPMAVGLALVPRHGAGTVMGCFAVLTSLSLRAGGVHADGLSLGALTSLTATGPLMDWTLCRSHWGWRQYFDFGVAGLASNLLAFIVRCGAKWLGWEHVGARPLSLWVPQAAVTYVVCGVLAGIISGTVWFYGRRRDDAAKDSTAKCHAP